MRNKEKVIISIFIISFLILSVYGINKINLNKDKTKFRIIYEGDTLLHNPYGVILVNPEKHPTVKLNEAAEFTKWLVSSEGQNAIELFEIQGYQLFTPNFNESKLSENEKLFWSDIEVGSLSGKIRLATTTSARDSGLLDYLLPLFYEVSNLEVEIIAVGTGAALDTAKKGNVDLVMVHARNLEDQFVYDGYGIHRVDLMYNDFVIIGPENDPAGVIEATSVTDALAKIYNSKSKFISRGDNSGTHNKELTLWNLTNLIIDSDNKEWSKDNSWYIESGSGMSATITIAFEQKGYTLTDRATWITMMDRLV